MPRLQAKEFRHREDLLKSGTMNHANKRNTQKSPIVLVGAFLNPTAF